MDASGNHKNDGMRCRKMLEMFTNLWYNAKYMIRVHFVCTVKGYNGHENDLLFQKYTHERCG